MSTVVKKVPGQRWKNRMYGTMMEVVEVDGGYVRIESVDKERPRRMRMHEAQLEELYEFVEESDG